MRGPQFMLGYWKSPDATAAVLRDGWYWSGDIVRVDEDGFYYVVDRRKEMMKYKGFSDCAGRGGERLLEHPVVRDCGVVSRIDAAGEEIPCAFVVVREEKPANQETAEAAASLRGRASHPLQNAARDLFVQSCRAPLRARSCAATCGSWCKASSPQRAGKPQRKHFFITNAERSECVGSLSFPGELSPAFTKDSGSWRITGAAKSLSS